MLCRAPWFALVLVGCEALTGAEAGPEVAPASEPAIVGPAALRAAIAAGVRRRGENEASYEVDAFVAALAVEELAGGSGGLKVEPALVDGAQVGYRLVEVVPGSAYALLGLRAGDVIEAIGEVQLDSPGHAAGLIGGLGRGAQVAVVRDGVGFSLDVRIAGGLSWAAMVRARTGASKPAVIAGVTEVEPGEPQGEPVGSHGGDPAGHVPKDRQGRGTETAVSKPAVSKPAPSKPAPSKPAGKPAAKPSGAGTAGTGVQCLSATSCTLDRKLFNAAVDDPGKLERQASIAAAKGGYRLTRVSPGSTVAALGFRAGDVITTVNGSRLDDDVAALGLYMGLGSTTKYVVGYTRNGARATKSIALR